MMASSTHRLGGNEKLLTQLKEIEEAAEQVLADKQELIDLDCKHHQTREALRTMSRAGRSHYKGDESRTWLATSSCFLKLPIGNAISLLGQELKQVDQQIDMLRTNLKHKVNILKDKEGEEELKGFHLKAMTKEEMLAVRQVIEKK